MGGKLGQETWHLGPETARGPHQAPVGEPSALGARRQASLGTGQAGGAAGCGLMGCSALGWTFGLRGCVRPPPRRLHAALQVSRSAMLAPRTGLARGSPRAQGGGPAPWSSQRARRPPEVGWRHGVSEGEAQEARREQSWDRPGPRTGVGEPPPAEGRWGGGGAGSACEGLGKGDSGVGGPARAKALGQDCAWRVGQAARRPVRLGMRE